MAISGKTKALICPPPRWVFAQSLYVWLSVQRWSQWCSQNLCSPFLRAVRLHIFVESVSAHAFLFFLPYTMECVSMTKHYDFTIVHQVFIPLGQNICDNPGNVCRGASVTHSVYWWSGHCVHDYIVITLQVEMPGNAPLFKKGFVMRKNIMEGPHKKGTLLYSFTLCILGIEDTL